MQSNRIGLIEERIAGIRDQALIVAGALAEYAADPERRAIETDAGRTAAAPVDRADAICARGSTPPQDGCRSTRAIFSPATS